MRKNWGIFVKRILVTALTLALIGGSVDLSGFTVSAQTAQEEVTQEEAAPGKAAQGESAQEKAAQGEAAQEKQTTVTVTGFAELPENIREQQLPVGAQESDIYLPESLTVTVEKTVMEDKDETDEEQSGTKGDSASKKESGAAEGTGSGEQGESEGSTGSEGQGAAEDTGSGEQGESEGSAGSEGQGAAEGTGSGEQGESEGGTGPEGQGMTGEAGNAAGEQGTAGQDNAAPENGNNSSDNVQTAGVQDGSGEGLVGRIADWLFAPMMVYAAENPAEEAAKADTEETTGNGDTFRTTEEVSLTGITWELNQDESDAAEFDAGEASNGFCYVYTPVLPDTDKDGNTLAVGDDVELPAIYVLVGEPQLALLNGDDVAEVTVGNGTPQPYQTVNEAFTAIKNAIDAASGDAASLNITLKFLADTTVTGLQCELGGKGKTSLTIDMNGKTVGIDWESTPAPTPTDFKLTMTNIEATLTGTGTLSATVNIGEKANLTAKGAIGYQGTLTIQEGGTATLENWNGNVGAKGDIEIGEGGSCTITGGTYNMIKVFPGAKLKVSGDATEIWTLYAYSPEKNGDTVEKRAEIALFGGIYAFIKFSGNIDLSTLENESFKCAIIDMLADGYKFYNSTDNETVITPARTDKELENVKVLSEPEVIVSFQITKKDGTKETKNFATWDKAMSYLSNSGNEAEFASWKKVEIILQKDATFSQLAGQMVSSDELPAELVLCSAGDKIYTLSEDGDPLYRAYTALHTNGQNLTVKNIKTSGASIKAVGGTVTIGDGASLAASGNTAGGTIDVTESTLILEDGARVSSTNIDEDSQIAIRMLNKSTLRIKKGAQITKGKVYIYGVDNKSIVVIEEGAKLSAIGSASDADPCVYCNLDSMASEVWNAMSSGNVYFLIDCNGVTLENSSNITQYKEKIYGRFDYESGTYGSNTKIQVPDTVCSYELTDGTKIAVDADHTFQMPSAKVKLLKHNPDASGACPNCDKTDLAKAYEAGELQINGLTGRTYDSWPQTLTGITLKGTGGSTKTLKGPSYKSGKELAQDSTDTANADLTGADYALVYANNINAYGKKPGDSDFDAAKAPKVTIIGQGKYTGTIEYYFTIGQGKLLMKDFEASDELTYNGEQREALQYGTLAYEADGTDAAANVPMGQSGADASISVCTGKTVDKDGFTSVAAPKIEYSTDNGSTWTEIDANVTDESRQNYCITDAGTYDFQIRATDGANAASAAQTLTATIQPKNLTSEGMGLDRSQSITAYYTGKPIIPTNKDHSITNAHIFEDNSPYVLKKGKDFTISATDNTAVGNATLTFTGMGNYTGTLTDTFYIVYAFELAQTTASADHWYNTDVPAVFGANNTTGGTADALKQLIYRNVKRADNTYNTELSGDVKLYTTLEDAIANNTNAGYTFTDEGEQTRTLYGRDTAKGYIANPVAITVKIDKTAPTWADKDGNTENYGIQIRSNWWRTLLNKVSFGFLYNGATLDMKIHANDKKTGVDEVSGIDKYYYYVDTITNAADDTATKTKAELDALAAQGKFQSADPDSGIFSGEGATISGMLSNSENYVIYAYAVDKAGNKSDYICTEGLVVDDQAPVLTVTAPTQEEGTLKDDEATIMIHSDEAAELVYFRQNLYNGEEQLPYVEAVNEYIKLNENQGSRLPFATKKDGKWVAKVKVGDPTNVLVTSDNGYRTLHCVELKAGQNSITLTGLNNAKRADIWMVAIDKAGNITDVKTLNFTTTKEMPRITTLPQLSGVYGDTPAELKVTPGVAKIDNGRVDASGIWEVVSNSTEKLEVGTTEQCTVKFIPNDSSFAEAYVKVTPTIAKRPISIKVGDMTKAYKDSMPEIAFDIPSSNIGKVQLADGDTKETIKSSLQLVTEATADSEVGTYSFTVTSDSQNYEVTTYYVENLIDQVSMMHDHGTLTITQAAGELTKGSGYTGTKIVIYGDAPFSLDVTANHTESRIEYVVTDEKDADGNAIGEGDGHILSVSADGKVTINGAGSAKIQISLPASKNYTEATALTVDVTINRKNFEVSEQSRSYLYDRESEDTISLAALLPQDSGSVTYSISSWDSNFFEMAQAVPSGKLYYTVKNGGTIGDKGEIKVTVKTANYTINGSSDQITIKAELVDRKPVEPKTTVSVKNPTLTYGEPVSRLQFNPVTFVEQGTGKTVAGTLKWDNPGAVLDAGAQSVTWTFTPNNDEYQIVTGSLSITVERAVPKVGKAPVPGAYVYHPSNTLASDKAKAVLNAGAKVQGVVTDAQGRTVAGSWSWKEKEKPNAGTHTYTAVFTPTDTANYETVEKPVTLTVEKAYVSIKDEIDGLHLPDYVHGEYLYNHELPIGFAYYAGKGGDYGDVDKTITEVSGRYVWAAPETRVKYTDGYSAFTGHRAKYELEFIPDDTTNYAGTMETKNGWPTQKMAWVFVYKADNPPYRPSAQMTVAHTCQKVSDVKLPKDWKWSGNDGDKSLEDNQAVSAQAEYTGSDADCYKNILCSITITRSDCDHAKTEVKNAKAATCSSEGSTGETWCTVCGKKLDDGCVLVKDATKHETLTETVVRQATTSQTGLKVQECSDCHYRKEVTIPKLSGGSTSQGGDSAQQPEAPDGNGQNTAGGGSDGSGGSSTSGENDGGQGTTTIQDGAKPQTKEQQPAQTPAEPANTNRNSTEQKTDDTKPESGDPFIKGENGKEGWDVIHDELEAAGEGETVSVDMNGATTVPGEILGNISGKDITLVLDMGGGITWSINGKSFTKADPGDIDFGVTYGEQAGKTIPVDVINNVTGERYSMNLTLAYDGEFGFSAVLSINMDSSNAGLYANLFYYNPESGELEFMCAGQIGEDGSVGLTFTHASDYTIVIDTEPMDLADASDAVDTENAVQNQEAEDADAMTEAAQDKTDKNNGWLFLLAAIAAVAAATGVVVLQKRRKQQ